MKARSTTAAATGTGAALAGRKGFMDVQIFPASGPISPDHRLIQTALQSTLENIVVTSQLASHASISVVLQVLGDDGSLVACCLNAAVSALIDCGVPLRCTVHAISCGFVAAAPADVPAQLYLDLTHDEEG
jgi:ribonuclease PH